MTNELDVLKKLHYGTFPESELLAMYYQFRNKYRIRLKLIQQPNFPERDAFNIIPTLYPMDLIRVIKNKRTKTGIRKRAEMEFVNKYIKYPLGEKLSYMKVAPHSLMAHFIEETDRRVLTSMLRNPYMTEELVLRFINRRTDRQRFYEVLAETEWFKRPQVALAISLDNAAPIKMVIMCIPYLSLVQLEYLYKNDNTHMIIKNNIIQYLNNRRPVDSGNSDNHS